MLSNGVIRVVYNASKFWNLSQQRAFNPVLQRDIHRSATLTTPAELQHRNVVFHDLHQCHHAAVRGQTLQDVVRASDALRSQRPGPVPWAPPS